MDRKIFIFLLLSSKKQLTPWRLPVLRSRDTVPYVRTFPPSTEERLIILPGEDSSNSSTARGRPIGPEYYDFSYKIAFMDQHKIDISVVSLANPWLDFLPPSEAAETAMLINDDMDASCGLYPGRLYAFGTLPLSASVEEITEEIRRLKGMPWIRGVVMGTSGLGNGLDDERLNPVYEALEETGQTMFLHPHYGLPTEVYGPRASEYGHVLPLALGYTYPFPACISHILSTEITHVVFPLKRRLQLRDSSSLVSLTSTQASHCSSLTLAVPSLSLRAALSLLLHTTRISKTQIQRLREAFGMYYPRISY